ncbi:MAG: hypothetical protein R6V49_09510 [Bacteroidales bacterium]
MTSRASYILVLLFGAFVSFAQILPEKGVPLLRNYTPNQYLSKGKIWDIHSAPNGIVYMAADKGLLEFDGKSWQCYQGSDGFTRSLLVVNDSLIYTGSDLDFGVWKKNRRGSFDYTSLYPFRKEIQDKSEEFWDVHMLHGDILFVSAQNIYLLQEKQVVRISAPTEFAGSFAVNDSLYFADINHGVFVFDRLSLKKLIAYPDDANYEIAGIYHNNGIVLVTRNAGLLLYSDGKLLPVNSPVSETLKTAKVFSFERIGDAYLAFGTVTKGLFITDLEGNVIHQINKYKGLLSNAILCMHYSPSGKFWAGLDYGVSSLMLSNDLTYFYDYRGDVGTGYAAAIHNDFFYLGTNQGLYYTRWEDLNNDKEFTGFQLIPGTTGQVWSLQNIDDRLFIGHDHGLFVLKDNIVEKLSDHEGVWTVVPYGDFLLTGNYNGIEIFEKSGGEWIFRNKMDLILGSCNQLVIEKENILWVNIPNFGIIRAVLNENVNPVRRLIFNQKFFEGNDPYLFKNHKGINIYTDRNQYIYDEDDKKFIRIQEMRPRQNVDNLLVNIYQALPLHPDYDFYPVYNGFALKFLKYGNEISRGTPGMIIRKAEAFNNYGSVAVFPGEKLPYKLNNLRIEFIAPNAEGVLYQYKISGDDHWSALFSDNFLELIGLSQGNYTIQLRALMHGDIISEQAIAFRIAPPWYRSRYAFASYVLMLFIALVGISRWQKLLLKKQRKKMLIKEQNSLRQMAEKHRERIMMLEQERLQAEYDQLKQQLKNKTIELAKKSKDNEDKNRLLLSLKDKFDLLQNDPVAPKTRLSEIRRLLDSYLKADDRTFEIQMDELHQELFRKLKESFPSLSNNDLRLCAYLKVGLNSKEIADILNIQPSSSYISRSRLRKKLNLRPDEDLYDFLNGI